MAQQPLAEERLARLFRQLVAIIVLMLLLFFIGWRYFDSIDKVAQSGLTLKQQQLSQTANLVRAQWLREGKAELLLLDWEVMERQILAPAAVVRMSMTGWPMPTYGSDVGCRKLWQDLMGYDWDNHQPVLFDEAASHCQYNQTDGLALVYSWKNGTVSQFKIM